MKALVCFFVFSEVLSLLALGVFSCDCAVDSIQTREGSIRDNWNYADDVFAARVDDMYCKCYPQADSVNTLNCIHIKADASDTGRLVAINEQKITCQSGRGFMSLYYQNCDYVMGKARSSASIMEVTAAPVTIDNTEKPYCGIGGNIEEATSGKGCDLTQQPCFYTLTVTKVFKGIKQVDQILNSSGPDALTTCGSPRTLLQVGQTYMVGLGSVCTLIQPWRPLSEYTSEDLGLLQGLSKEKPNSRGGVEDGGGWERVDTDREKTVDEETQGSDGNWQEVNQKKLIHDDTVTWPDMQKEEKKGTFIDDTGAWPDTQEKGDTGNLIDDTVTWPDTQEKEKDVNNENNFIDDTGAWPDMQRESKESLNMRTQPNNGNERDDSNEQWYAKTDLQQNEDMK